MRRAAILVAAALVVAPPAYATLSPAPAPMCGHTGSGATIPASTPVPKPAPTPR